MQSGADKQSQTATAAANKQSIGNTDKEGDRAEETERATAEADERSSGDQDYGDEQGEKKTDGEAGTAKKVGFAHDHQVYEYDPQEVAHRGRSVFQSLAQITNVLGLGAKVGGEVAQGGSGTEEDGDISGTQDLQQEEEDPDTEVETRHYDDRGGEGFTVRVASWEDLDKVLTPNIGYGVRQEPEKGFTTWVVKNTPFYVYDIRYTANEAHGPMISTRKELSYPKSSIVTMLPHDLDVRFPRSREISHSVRWMNNSDLSPLFRFLSGQPNLQLPRHDDKQCQDAFIRDHWTPNFDCKAAISFMLANNYADEGFDRVEREMMTGYSKDLGVTHEVIKNSLTVHRYTISGYSYTSQKRPCGKVYTTAFHDSLAKLGIGLWKCISQNNGSWLEGSGVPGGFLKRCAESNTAKKLRGLLDISAKRQSDRRFNRGDHGEFGFSRITTTLYEMKGDVDWSGLDEAIARKEGGANLAADDKELHSDLSDNAILQLAEDPERMMESIMVMTHPIRELDREPEKKQVFHMILCFDMGY